MPRVVKLVLVCALVMAVATPLALAQQAAGGRTGRAGRAGGQPGATGLADRFRTMMDTRTLTTPLTLAQKGRDEDQRYRTECEALLKELNDVRAKVKKDVDGGLKQEDAEAAHADEAKAVAKKLLDAYVVHLDNMSKLIKDGGDALLTEVATGLLKPQAQRGPGARGGPGAGGAGAGGAGAGAEKPAPPPPPPPPKDTKTGDNPFTD